MSSKIKTVLLAALFVLFIAAALFAYGALGRRGPDPEGADPGGSGSALPDGGEEGGEGKMAAPDFTVYDADGSPVMLSDFIGKPIVLNFWASWCSPCKREMPEFDAIHGQVGGEVIFMMVDLVDGQQETEEAGARYVAEKGFSFPVYFDLDREAAQKYGIISIPQTLFIDREGYIAARLGGSINARALERGIELIK